MVCTWREHGMHVRYVCQACKLVDMRALDRVPKQRLLEIVVLPPKGRKLAFVRTIKQEENQAYLLRSDKLTGGRLEHEVACERFCFVFLFFLVSFAIESQCRRRKCDNALNHPAAAVIIKSSWAGREGQPMIVLLCLEACFTSACCSSFRLLFFATN